MGFNQRAGFKVNGVHTETRPKEEYDIAGSTIDLPLPLPPHLHNLCNHEPPCGDHSQSDFGQINHRLYAHTFRRYDHDRNWSS
jgi:hypothetical protein